MVSCPQDYTAGGVDTSLPKADSNKPVGRALQDLLLTDNLPITYSQAQSTHHSRNTQLQITGEMEAFTKSMSALMRAQDL